MEHSLVSIVQVENVSPGKTEKNVKYLRQHSTDFHQVFINVIALILETDDLENVCQGQNVQNCSFLKCEYFFKKLPTPNLAKGSSRQ